MYACSLVDTNLETYSTDDEFFKDFGQRNNVELINFQNISTFVRVLRNKQTLFIAINPKRIIHVHFVIQVIHMQNAVKFPSQHSYLIFLLLFHPKWFIWDECLADWKHQFHSVKRFALGVCNYRRTHEKAQLGLRFIFQKQPFKHDHCLFPKKLKIEGFCLSKIFSYAPQNNT